MQGPNLWLAATLCLKERCGRWEMGSGGRGNYPTEQDLSENAHRPSAAAQEEHWDIFLGKPGLFILSLCQEIANMHSRS